MQHKFQIGDIVEMIPDARRSNRLGGPCEVLARLPYEGADLQYKVQPQGERNQRIVSERDLRPSSVVSLTPASDLALRIPRRS